MKNKVNKGVTQKLQVEVDIMEQRISGLKQILQYQKEQAKERNISSQGSTRWSSASTNIPLKNYGKHVLEKHRQQKMQQKNKSRPSSRSSSLSKQTQQTSQTKQTQQQNQSFLSQSLNTNQNNVIENLKKALIVQQQYSNEVIKFLNQIGLEQHSVTLLENGFDEMDLLKEIQIEHLKDMKIPPLDARKILNKIQKLNEEQEQQQIHKQQQIQKLKESQQQSETQDIYDEEEQHRLFLEAVLEYRQQSQKQNQETQLNDIIEQEEEYGIISSRQNKKEDQQRNKMKFLLQGSKEWNMFDIDYDQNQGTDKQQIILDKISCFQCYKLFDEKYAIILDNKQFCTNQCLEQYNLQNIYLCRSQSCSKQINIEQAFYDIGQWFCNQECFKQYQWESVNIRGRTNISL